MKEVKQYLPLSLHPKYNQPQQLTSSSHFIGYVSYDGAFDEVDRKEGEGDRRSARAFILQFRSK